MRSWRLLLQRVAINEVAVEVAYADVFVVLREGDERPGPNDWEATVRTSDRQHFPPGTYELSAETLDDISLSGHAVLRYTAGHHHTFRADGDPGGVAAPVACPGTRPAGATGRRGGLNPLWTLPPGRLRICQTSCG